MLLKASNHISDIRLRLLHGDFRRNRTALETANLGNLGLSAQVGKDGVFELPAGVEVKKNEKTILVLDAYSEEKANALMSLALAEGAKVVAVLSLTGSDAHADHGCVFHSLL